ncbi:MAG: polyprenyl synthetase family protein [candidate division Zixibacteria bacterium]|nr:polyprenyl synthetase family protein [candidate division Zixibacteria bacterium]
MSSVDATGVRTYLKEKGQFVDQLLDRYLPPIDAEPKSLHAAMRYSVLAPGKRLRPILALAAFEYCGGDAGGEDQPIHFGMAGLEMVHTYSLIHDDLPCMDDDDLRRGMPTCHKKFNEATAVLAGDALHDVAFLLMARTGLAQAGLELAQALGTEGMIGGQMADVNAEGHDVDREEVIGIHRRKTGALIRCSLRLGAILAGSSDDQLNALTKYGEKIGLAFQIIDDILDVEGDSELLGKNIGSDSRKKKATYPGAVGLDVARRDAAALIEEGVSVLDVRRDSVLKDIAYYIANRDS